MKYVICKTGETQPGSLTVTLHRGETTMVVKGVPADVCDTCGEYYLEEQVAEKLHAQAEEAAKRNAEVEVLRYGA